MNQSTQYNDSLTPKLWGKAAWKGLHCATFGYPVAPTEENKDTYMQFFNLLGYFLPNKESRFNYRRMVLNINNNPAYAHIKLKREVFESRDALTLWFYNVHEEFNKLLKLNYGVTYEYVLKKYETYRARCDTKVNPNSGLITKIWGPPMWILLHSICYAYPISVTEKKKQQTLEFFELFGKILPCIYCRESYAKFIKEGISQLTMQSVESRRNLTIWAFSLHESVNIKLNVNYAVKLYNVDSKYDAGRIKNGVYPQYYDNNYCKECPIIPVSLIDNFVYYAKQRQTESNLITNADFKYINKIKQGISITYDNSKCDFWCKRNIECNDIIKKMRLEGISSIETTGPWKGLPTLFEIKLILRLASNLDSDLLSSFVHKLPHSKNTHIYKLAAPPSNALMEPNNIISTTTNTNTNTTKQTDKPKVKPVATGCVMPANNKINSYKYSYMHECSILDMRLCANFIKYAKLRKLSKCDFKFFIAYYKYYVLKDRTINIEQTLMDRNNECDTIIEHMQQEGVESIETGGQWINLPTIDELKLIIRLTSNLSIEQLTKLTTLVPH